MRAIAAIAALLVLAAPLPALAGGLYIPAGRLLDVESGQVLIGQCILTKGERIVRIEPCAATPEGAERVDWPAHTVLPGLIDLHTHLSDTGSSADLADPLKTSPVDTVLIGARNARLTLEAGFTMVRDVGTYRGLTDVALRNGINRGLVPGPRMFVAGAYLTHPGGGGELNGVVPDDELPADMRLGVLSSPGQAAERATYLFDHGVDFLKLIATGAVLAIGTEPGEPELTEAEMRAGVRSIEHASLIDEEGLRLARDKGVWLVMDIFNGDYIDEVGTREGWPEENLRKNRETMQVQRDNFRRAVELGVPLAFGSDAGVYPHGLNARQFRYMVANGMTPLQAIRAATTNAAQVIGHGKELGRIAPGAYADIIAVTGDPLADVTVLERMAGVVKGAKVIR